MRSSLIPNAGETASYLAEHLNYVLNEELAMSCANEVNGWIDVLDKAPCEFDRELVEQLIS